MTLDDWLGRAYAALHGGSDESEAAVAGMLAADETVTTEAIQARVAALRPVEGRCIVSRSARSFLDRVIALRG